MTALESSVSNGCHAVGDVHGGKAVTALESIASDRCDAVGDGHGGKAGIFESITSDGCHLTRSIHISDFFWDNHITYVGILLVKNF